jgi:hypothetical protein
MDGSQANEYIGLVCLELRKLALNANLTMLAFLLSMAALEALQAPIEASDKAAKQTVSSIDSGTQAKRQRKA